MKNLNYLIDQILYQIFKTILNTYLKNGVNPIIRIYITKMENIITFKIKTGYHL